MPVAITETPARQAPLEPPRKRWTRAECEVLESSGLLDQEKLELIDGELISKMGKNRPHVNSHSLTIGWLFQTFGALRVNTGAPIDVAPEDNPTNEPQPDAIVLHRELLSARPRPEDVCLVVEIADSSLNLDLTTKARLYARAGIADYWVLDTAGRRLIVHRDPRSGKYLSVVAYREEESVAPLAASQADFLVSDAFPPPEQL